MEFEKDCILTGVEKRVSKEKREYVLVHYLNTDGQTFSTVLEGELPQGLKQLDKVRVKFKLITGRYTQLRTLSLSKVV